MKRALRWLPAVLWALGIFVLSSQSRLPELPFTFDSMDKVAHAVVFGVLGLLVAFALEGSLEKRALWAVLLTALYGVSDEAHQSMVPGRSVELLDLLADIAGAALAVLTWRRLHKRRLQKGRV